MSLNFYQFNPYVSEDSDSPAPCPIAPTPTSELIERHTRLIAVGLSNCRAAQGLSREIQRRQTGENQQVTAKWVSIANYDADERRDDDGKWTIGGAHTGTFATKPTEIPKQHSGIFATIGKALQKAGEKVRDEVAAAMFEVAGDPQDALKQLGYRAEDLKRMGYTDVEPDTGVKPFEQGMQMLPPVQRAVSRAAEGIVISTPKLAIAAVDPLAGVIAFGSTPEGFDLKQAVLALVLPEIGELGGDIAESIAAKAGISSKAALQLLKKLGGAAAVAGAIGLDELQEILKLPPEQRKQALLDAAANAASTLVLGMLGGKKESEEPFDPERPPAKPSEFPAEKPPGEVELKTHEIKQPEPAQKPPPLSAAERQALEEDIQARRPVSTARVYRANRTSKLTMPKGYAWDVLNNRYVYNGPDDVPVATTAAKTSSTPANTEALSPNSVLEQTDPTTSPPSESENKVTATKAPLKIGEVMTYKEFRDRSVKGDNLEAHELWQHANIKAQGLATKRLSGEVSKNNPVIVLDKQTHKQVNAAQRAIKASSQVPTENISDNARILRRLAVAVAVAVAGDKAVDRLEQMSKQHAEKNQKR